VAAVPQATHWEFRRPPRKAERIKKVGDERRVRALARWSLLLRPAPANGCCRRRTPLTTGGQVRCGRTCTTRQIIDAAPWSGQILITVSVCASKAFALPLTAVCPEHRRHVETRMEEEKMHAQDDVLRKVQFRQRERTKLQTRRKANYQSAVPGTQLHTVPATPATPAGVPAAKPPTRYGQPVAIKDRDYYRRDGYLWSDLVHVAPERMHLVVRPEMLEADEVTQPPARHHNTHPPPSHARPHAAVVPCHKSIADSVSPCAHLCLQAAKEHIASKLEEEEAAEKREKLAQIQRNREVRRAFQQREQQRVDFERKVMKGVRKPIRECCRTPREPDAAALEQAAAARQRSHASKKKGAGAGGKAYQHSDYAGLLTMDEATEPKIAALREQAGDQGVVYEQMLMHAWGDQLDRGNAVADAMLPVARAAGPGAACRPKVHRPASAANASSASAARQAEGAAGRRPASASARTFSSTGPDWEEEEQGGGGHADDAAAAPLFDSNVSIARMEVSLGAAPPGIGVDGGGGSRILRRRPSSAAARRRPSGGPGGARQPPPSGTRQRPQPLSARSAAPDSNSSNGDRRAEEGAARVAAEERRERRVARLEMEAFDRKMTAAGAVGMEESTLDSVVSSTSSV
jgi:chemotaxis protein histidine kinase CheA